MTLLLPVAVAWVVSSIRGLTLIPYSAISLFCSLLFSLFIGTGGVFGVNWLGVGCLDVLWGWVVDAASSALIGLVAVVAIAVIIFSGGYLADDPHIGPFIGLLFLFSASMLTLVSGPTLFQAFIGWEGVGLLSYLLINFWSGRGWAGRAATKAMVINKIGDVAFLVSAVIIYCSCGSVCLPSLSSFLAPPTIWVAVFFLLAASTKSAQFMLHFWLPDAMEGPTPVSALIHAATMVTAGVFLIIRLGRSMEGVMVVMAWLGGVTAVASAAIAVGQWDVKKVIAYSTCSQLGYLVLILGFGGLEISLFHLITHGFFKALFFLGAGYIIFLSSDEQDLRRGGLLSSPIPYAFMLPAALALSGFPFFAGFYSKDALLELAYSSAAWSGACWFAVIAASLTALYSTRLLLATSLTSPRGVPPFSAPILSFWIGLPVLGALSAIAGYILISSAGGPLGPPPSPVSHMSIPFAATVGALAAIAFTPSFVGSAKIARHSLTTSAHLGYLDYAGGSVGHAAGAWGGTIAHASLDRSLLPGFVVMSPVYFIVSFFRSISSVISTGTSVLVAMWVLFAISSIIWSCL